MAYGPASDPNLKNKSSSTSYGPASASKTSSSSSKATGPASAIGSNASSKATGPASSSGTSTPKVYDKSNMSEQMYNDFLAMNATLPGGGAKPSSGGSSGSGYGSLGQPTSDTYYSSMAKDAIAKGNVDSMSDLLDSLNGVDKNSLTDVQKSSLYSAKKKLQSALEKADRDEGFGDYFSEIQDYISEMFGSAKAQSIPDSVWQKLNATYQMSDTVKKAYETTAQYLNQLSSGKTPYTDKLNGLIDNYNNRDPFSYNPDDDSLFQNALASAMRNGQTAMQDTMGQAAALTGGYGSSYATTAANNVYNQYINEAYDNLPQYYQMAMQAYGLEDERLLNEIGLAQQQDAKEYEKIYNAWQANSQTANDLYSKEYNEYLGTLSQYQNNAGLILQSQAQQWDMMKGATSAALQLGNMYMDDYYNKLNAETQASQFEKELQYKYDALAQDQAQFESSLALKTLSGGGSGGSGGSGGGNPQIKSLSDNNMRTLKNNLDKCESWNDVWRELDKWPLNEDDQAKVFQYIDDFVHLKEDKNASKPITDNVVNSRLTAIKNNALLASDVLPLNNVAQNYISGVKNNAAKTNSSSILDPNWLQKVKLPIG